MAAEQSMGVGKGLKRTGEGDAADENEAKKAKKEPSWGNMSVFEMTKQCYRNGYTQHWCEVRGLSIDDLLKGKELNIPPTP